jgi:hypothetical protein
MEKLKFKSKRRLVKIKPQTAKNKVDKLADKARTALKCGIRISGNGKKYTETRANRCDVNLRKRI